MKREKNQINKISNENGEVTTDNEDMTNQNLWVAAKAIRRWKFIAIQSYLKKQEKHRIDNLTLHLKQLEKAEGKKLVEGKKS